MLNISVSDMGTNPGSLGVYCQVTITIMDMNDNAPVFDQDTLVQYIAENQPPSSVGVVMASDIDEEGNDALKYHLESGKS